ncbi:MAG: DUF59 domain-containing protein, partial [Actinobacteria bacterium]|nr:iron-sulfur cluster assembly protein [Actinomycetota bacterium]NIV56584.1 DUF59 domain-containing protein [Actinomycetota bacterium]NIX51394.1 DUF59 domain-containing protein [Actinomycetota bacterium]
MAVTREQVLAALSRVPYPGFTRDIVASGVVDALEISGDRVRLRL